MSSDAKPPATLSVSRRFLITFCAQISKSAFSFLTGMVAARGLGPSEYGNLAFLIGSFTALRLAMDMASGQAFFTLSSQRPRSRTFFLYYAAWFGLFQITLPVLLIVWLLPHSVVDVVWQSQGRDRIVMAFLATNLQYLFWPQITQLGEVVRRTLITQSLTIAVSLVQFAVILGVYLLSRLTLPIYFITIAAGFFAGGVVAFLALPHPWNPQAQREDFLGVVSEFTAFCRPLVVSMGLQAVSGWVEVWLLQHFAGAVQQSFFALGMQISLIGLLATTALQNIFWREVAELEGKGDDAQTHAVYIKTSRALLLTTAAPIAFLILWTPQIVDVLLGPKYHGAIPAVAIMFLNPVTQTITTLAIVMFSVMRRTDMLALFSSGYALLYMAASYFLLAPIHATVPGLGLGAAATAAKLVLFSLGQLLVWEGWIHYRKSWHHDWAYRFRLLAILAAATLTVRAFGAVLLLWLPPILALLISGVAYLALLGYAIYRWPDRFGLPLGLQEMLKEKAGVFFAARSRGA